jgi:hypothetical protein
VAVVVLRGVGEDESVFEASQCCVEVDGEFCYELGGACAHYHEGFVGSLQGLAFEVVRDIMRPEGRYVQVLPPGGSAAWWKSRPVYERCDEER